MSNLLPYKDLRDSFFKKYFELGLSYSDYAKSGNDAQNLRWSSGYNSVAPTANQEKAVGSWTRRMNILVASGIWCGDCSRQGPMLKKISDANKGISLSFVESKAHPELMDELRINGAEKVPVVVILSEDFFEISRFGDKHLSVYRRTANALSGCEIGLPSQEDLQTELQEWVDHIERAQILLRLSPLLRKRYQD